MNIDIFVIFNNGLKWMTHIETLKVSCHKILNLFKLLSHKSWSAAQASLLRSSTMLLKSKLDFGSEAYGSASKRLFDSNQYKMKQSALQQEPSE